MPLPSHIGIHLNRAYQAWLDRFIDQMQTQGHTWFTLGRANLLGVMDREGTRQADLLERSGLTKQALNQMLDGLERHDIIRRAVDLRDKRSRIIQLTHKGIDALRDADGIKADIQSVYAAKLGAEDLAQLEDLLKRATDA